VQRLIFIILLFYSCITFSQNVPESDFSKQPFGKSGLFNTVHFNGKKYFVCEVNPRQYSIEAFNRVAGSHDNHDFNTIAKAKQGNLLFAVNGGMYHPDLSPVGLFVAEGKVYNKLNLKKDSKSNFSGLLPNGVFLVDSSGKALIVTSDNYAITKYKTRLATQSGPMLVIDGKFNSHFTKGSANVNIRNGVGVNKKGDVVFIISEEPVNFYELAELFRDKMDCRNALYLDGFVSQYYVPELHGSSKTGYRLGVFLTVSKCK
jgi:uncharacterized protein YigE (DUF2233 family)